MAKCASFYELTQKYANNDEIEFVLCYVPEAHPEEGWKIKANKRQIKQAENIKDRLQSLKYLIEDIDEKINENSKDKISILKSKNITCIADVIDEPNLDFYLNAVPDRLVVIKNNTIVFKGGYGPWFYNMDEIKQYLQQIYS